MGCDGLTFGDCSCDGSVFIPPNGGPPWPPPWINPPPPVGGRYFSELQIIWRVKSFSPFNELEVLYASPGWDYPGHSYAEINPLFGLNLLTTTTGQSRITVEYMADSTIWAVSADMAPNAPNVSFPQSGYPLGGGPYSAKQILNVGGSGSFKSTSCGYFANYGAARTPMIIGAVFGLRVYWS
jgi:hypothetical protein